MAKITAFEFKRPQSKLSKNAIFDKLHQIFSEVPVNLAMAMRLSSNNAILTNREEDNCLHSLTTTLFILSDATIANDIPTVY